MAPGRKRSVHAHQAIMDATLAALREGGYNQTSIEGVAAGAGVGKTTIYRWWPTKADLVIEAVSQYFQDPPPITGDSFADLRAMIESMIAVINGPVGQVLLGLAADLAENPAAGRRLSDLLGPLRAANAAVLLHAAGRGELPHDIDTDHVLDTLVGTLVFRLLMGRPLDSNLAQQLASSVMTGATPRLSADRTTQA